MVTNMLWVIQDNLFNEAGYARFVEALDRLEIPYITVKPIPFTNKILPADFDSFTQDVADVDEPFIDTNQNIMAFGATSLTRISQSRGWYPGTYLNENFDFAVWREGYGKENVLNHDAVVGRLGDGFDLSVFKTDDVFLRPVLDTKTFAGEVKSKYDFGNWRQSIMFVDEHMSEELIDIPMLTRDTVIMVSSTKKIYTECRVFVVNQKIVTASMYKQGNDVITNPNVDARILQFATEMIQEWIPAEAYVIDIADTPDGLKVIEINNINSAGYYAADVQKIIVALEEMVKYNKARGLNIGGKHHILAI